ncbi:MAG: methyltransferase domain-containing protein [Alphaproteobacteria bacterium]|nr:methyltransferase domain-containing protein [Alphaproteobacteria bacterium]
MPDPIAAPTPNAPHLAVWDEIIARKYLRFARVLVGSAAPHGDTALADQPVRPGDRVLDVGCGLGDSTVAIARAVGPNGRAVGLDGCAPLLAAARGDDPGDLPQLAWQLGDAQALQAPSSFDRVFSRFGTMFFESPVAAFRALRSTLRPGGAFTQVVWRTRHDNPWLELGRGITAPLLPPVPDTAETCGPGPFSLADPAALRWYLHTAGFTDVEITRSDAEAWIGADVDEAADFQLAIGPAAEQIRTAGALGEARRPAIRDALRDALGAFQTPTGVRLPSSAWVAHARG